MFRASGVKLNLSSGIASAASTTCFSMALMSRSTTEATVCGACCGAAAADCARGRLRSKRAAAQTAGISRKRILSGGIWICSIFVSMRLKVVADDLAVFHDTADAFEFSDVGDGVAGDGDEIGESPWFNRTHAVLPTEHFRGVCRNRADNVKRGHSRLV